MKKRKILTKAYRILLVFLLTGSTLALASVAMSAAAPEMPGFTHLESIYNNTKPTDVAIDAQGRVYVTDSKNKGVLISTQSGQRINFLPTATKPKCVAVDASGRIFVGSQGDGSVTVYGPGPGFGVIGALGAGAGEFKLPSDIAVDSAGNIYVVDMNNNTVGVYGPGDLKLFKSIGTPGNLDGKIDGQLWFPSSIAINEAATEAELIILDHPFYYERASRGEVLGARLQIFKMDGTWDRSYNKTGVDFEAGDLWTPRQIAVDGKSNIYVTDSYLNKIMVYAEADSGTALTLNFLGMIDNATTNMRQPAGLTISTNNLLFVVRRFHAAGVRGLGIDVFGLDTFTTSMVAPSPLIYEATVGGNNPAPKTMTVKNLGNSQLSWTANSNTSWIALTATSAQPLDPAATSTPLEVPVSIEGLEAGKYDGIVDVVAGGVTDQVNVKLTITPNPLLVTPETISLTSKVGTSPTVQTLTVSNGGSAPLKWLASADQDWVTLSAEAGSAPAEVKLFLEVTGLAKGEHNVLITFTREGDDPCPVTVAVTLTLADPDDTPVVNVPSIPNPGDRGLNVGGKVWRVDQVLAGTNLRGVWGLDRKNIFAVGDKGAILQFDGKDWTPMQSGSEADLYSVWGVTADNVYAVGSGGHILHYNGKTWSTLPVSGTELLEDVFGATESSVVAVSTFGAVVDADTPGPMQDSRMTLRSIWGSNADNFYAVGEQGTILHYNGPSGFETTKTVTEELLNSVWGRSDSDVFAVGEKGTILHKGEKGWTKMESGTTQTLLGVWGNSRNEVFAVGADATVLYYNGRGWNTLMAGSDSNVALNDVWAAEKSFVVAVGDDGIILTAHKAKFPWNAIIRNIAQAAKDKEKEEKTKK